MPLRGTNQEFNRSFNRRIILEAIRTRGPISKAEIARAVGLTFQTVTTIARQLETQDLIHSSRDSPKGRGQPPQWHTINPQGGYTVGLHVTPLSMEAALVNLVGEIVARYRAPLGETNPKLVFREIGKLTAKLSRSIPQSKILGAGMVMPGPFGVDSMSFVGPTTLKGWQGIDMAARLASELSLPSFVDVDVVAAALGEHLYGAARAYRNFYYLYFGLGLGGVLVNDGQPMRGAHGNAVEIGHLPLVPNGEPCICGNRGCLERYLSFEALKRSVATYGEAGRSKWISETAPLLRKAILSIETMLDPATIVIGGYGNEGVLRELVAEAQPLHNSIAARSDRKTERLILSEHGDDAILRGAAALAIEGILTPRADVLFVRKEEGAIAVLSSFEAKLGVVQL